MIPPEYLQEYPVQYAPAQTPAQPVQNYVLTETESNVTRRIYQTVVDLIGIIIVFVAFVLVYFLMVG